MNVNLDCALCVGYAENHEHLFCGCAYTRSILNYWPVPISTLWQDLKDDNAVGANMLDDIRSNITYLFITASFYSVWMEHNRRIHNTHRMPAILLAEIKRNLRDKLASCGEFKKRLRQNLNLLIYLY